MPLLHLQGSAPQRAQYPLIKEYALNYRGLRVQGLGFIIGFSKEYALNYRAFNILL